MDTPLTPTSNPSSFDMLDFDVGTPQTSAPHHVAIVGLSCRTAGGNNTPSQLWDYLLQKKHASGTIPSQRWEPWLRRDPRNVKILQNIVRKGYFLDHLEDFDAAFFGISPKEAELMDPHQRLSLELAWEALENAGIDPKCLAGSDTAVYMGVDSDDYSRMLLEDLPNIEAWTGIGTAYHGISNRISYHLDLQGPSAAVDAACASSLVAIHLAYQALVTGESTTAICGGVNVICAPGLTHMLQKAGALSTEGVCRSFDDQACGYARGEGGAIVVLKRMDAAISDGDNIIAVLKGTASAQDGKTNGIMAPNAKAQELVARQALSRAGDVKPNTVQYVEAHATSTSLGDPTEISAIANVYGAGRAKGDPCFVGSIKPNVGHLEAAAGAIGFVKAVLAVHKAELAPQTLLNTLNTKIDWVNSGLEVVRERKKWPAVNGPRRAAVCCYGYGGSVCHAIIEQAPKSRPAPLFSKTHEMDGEMATLVLSAPQEKRLADSAASLANWLGADGQSEDLAAIARTLSQCRATHDFRAAFVVADLNEARRTLTEYANGKSDQWSVQNRVLGDDQNKEVVWVFSGHGAQWPDMGKELLKQDVFRMSVEELDRVIQSEMEFSALTALQEGDLGGSDRIQVLTYVMQIGLLELLKSKGLRPYAVIGHSVGEIAASVAAGCLTATEGAIIVSRRAKLYARVQGQGAMAMISLPFAQVAKELNDTQGIVTAIDCSPTSCVVSGETNLVDECVKQWQARGLKTWKVNTDVAFHSPMLDQLKEPLRQALAKELNPQPSNVPLYSTSHDDPRSNCLREVDYWTHNMVAPVRLVQAVESAVGDGYQIFMEVSSHPIVLHSISETIASTRIGSESITIGAMKRNAPPSRTVALAVAQLHTFGAHVDFRAQLGSFPRSYNVPNSPWKHKPYWKIISSGAVPAAGLHDVDHHTLLGGVTEVAALNVKVWSTELDDSTKPYPLTHPLDSTEIIPAAVYCNTFLKAAGATILDNLQLRVPLPMTADQREIQVVQEGSSLRMLSRLQSSPKPASEENHSHAWIEHSSTVAISSDMTPYQRAFSVPEIVTRIGNQLPNTFAWDYLQEIGVSGIAFPWAVLEHHGNEEEMLVKMDMAPDSQILTWNETSWAPFLDAATSVGSSIFFKSVRMRIVSGIDQVLVLSQEAPPKIGWLLIENSSVGASLKADISVLSEHGELLAKLRGMRFSDVEATNERTKGVDTLVHQLTWVPPNFSETPLPLSNVVLICNDAQLKDSYSQILQSTVKRLSTISSSDMLLNNDSMKLLERKNTAVIYAPETVRTTEQTANKSHEFLCQTTNILRTLSTLPDPSKLFVITTDVQLARSATALAHAPLHGFARIAASEYPDIWGGLIDLEGSTFPFLALKYVRNQSVIRMQDGLPRVPRLRSFTKARTNKDPSKTILPTPQGTYLITGGFGDLGVEVIDFLVRKGARRIVVVSRRALPPRRQWCSATGSPAKIIKMIQKFEAMGITIHALPIDIGSPSATSKLIERLDMLDLPPVTGVVHAAGVSGYGYIQDMLPESLGEVMAPKVQGALNLHEAFPSGTLDFFVLFSSIGQLIGTPGQAAYASSNAFLDSIATHRREQGCNTISIQWTAWRGLGLASDTNLVDLELDSKGVTDITVQEGFDAWEYLSKHDTDHAVVTRIKILDADEAIPCALISDVVQRRARITTTTVVPTPQQTTPKSGPELKTHISLRIRQCLSTVLHLDIEEIDERVAIADLGVDSVMTVALRQQLQKAMGIVVPPTLTWNCPTVKHLVDWFYEKLVE